MKEFLKQMVSSGKTLRISSKRVCGVLLIVTVCFCMIYNCITGTSSPDMATAVIVAACTLLGCEGLFDSISKFSKK